MAKGREWPARATQRKGQGAASMCNATLNDGLAGGFRGRRAVAGGGTAVACRAMRARRKKKTEAGRRWRVHAHRLPRAVEQQSAVWLNTETGSRWRQSKLNHRVLIIGHFLPTFARGLADFRPNEVVMLLRRSLSLRTHAHSWPFTITNRRRSPLSYQVVLQ